MSKTDAPWHDGFKNRSAAQEAGHPFFGTPSKLREKPEHRRPSLDLTYSVLGYRGDTWNIQQKPMELSIAAESSESDSAPTSQNTK